MSKRLALFIFAGLILGAIVGLIFPSFGVAIQPLGTMFINLVEMVILPVVFFAIVVGAAGVADIRRMGKIGLKSIVWFEIITTIIILLGIILADLLQPGAGVQLASAKAGDISVAKQQKIDIVNMIVNIPPKNIVDAFQKDAVISVVFFAAMLGLAIASVKEKGKVVLQVFEGLMQASFTLIRWVMHAAPVGVFALAAYAAGKYGYQVFLPLAKVILVTYLGLAIVVFVLFPLVCRLVLRVPFFKVFWGVVDLFLIAFSSTSSEVVLPQLIEFSERIGVPRSIAAFVIPLGISWNADGTSLYLSVASLFVAQVAGLHLTLGQQITMILILIVTSKGIAGVPMAGLVVLLTTATAFGLPIQGVALLAAVDRVMDMARTGVNVFGHSVAAIAVAKWEREFDSGKLAAYIASTHKTTPPGGAEKAI
ncbi:dicarboxylate/amino acid:cation symporter [Alicyclobacillus macrosporangiidus]|jgi:proton glutamate symport protein|uniref:Proton glutamate symport protein n=1 Tax=Alicyclobacillus macrosporangiidus TaxID=392015 RepID=A0A1I7KVG9_9BACL|nr:dicarboxylate/amino acid:cation symporter [Alicyclobacillus macrosporangiidus]SFV01316.1 proton glutamate symport protein [Alicyclobacillus macrosporangiidus]